MSGVFAWAVPMAIRRIFYVCGLSAMAALPALAQVDTYPLAPFRAGPVPVLIRIAAPPVAFGPSGDDADATFSLAELGTDLSNLDFSDQSGAVPGRGRRIVPSDLTRPAAKTGQEPHAALTGDDDEQAPPPGGFTRGSVKIPSRFLKAQTIAPHTSSPDVSIDLDKRTTLGLFGEMSRTSRTDVEANLSKPDREVGAGFTLQYKFGTH
jgi:hypothetical protein